jgi:hypothetical protein
MIGGVSGAAQPGHLGGAPPLRVGFWPLAGWPQTASPEQEMGLARLIDNALVGAGECGVRCDTWLLVTTMVAWL